MTGRDDRYSFEMKRRGVPKDLFDASRQVTCPECGHSFNLFYSRAKLCTGCVHAINGCEFARCTHCDTEFPLTNFMSKYSSRRTSNYIESLINNYHDTFGERPGR
ncbi:hypothetical protein Mzhil_0361 [Methanosalsum zhilinae DSM 4017]|uniref:Uncharacterized protein n=1 Tax=Methanosalsum zhilinae (strain DSM 4017 / NBRC 107636 / OCM 62 / WeN5) TaxID=679901 RepID=F7XPB0_METZD|nr:hypothetical protein [Methanosalsum zhilinae]AEH60237.1 hypothetical protein Mzhil_0361 [Methanosalsum zhilinae DSM 4017]